MSSKASILERIRAAKPADRPLPSLPSDPPAALAEWEEAFRTVLAASKTTFITREEIPGYVAASGAKTIVSTRPECDGNLDPRTVADPLQLAGVDVAVLSARLGVAENGALWVSEEEAVHRVMPFITQHLVLVLEREQLVGTMHQAYRRIDIAATGFGVFIAGPSKTADIEQSLVIGAHGPRSLAVCLC
ncbi:L-lactate dehydrogenase complex protein LldG [Lewinella marina]|uniref:Lactate utilization protein B/C n=1 Tax=Neolewinella marina TaxID=438751 RepID=A0A2G0CGY5_9BACT|nr:LUD domain-containing protein [Neolewinella marina]NJB86286.1 L-lactate dehydrogenase complex protein LldG [Neolewinella marina]PHK99242.1 lactate utilization protein B/C [Neolewinella marina]